MSQHLYLIRHAETDLNAARVLQHPHTPLSQRGRAQARRLAERLADAGIARIVTSDYARAQMTAEAVRERTAAPLEEEALLQERNFGELRGRPYTDFDFDVFAQDYAPPGGESWDEFRARVARAWSRIQALAAATPGHLAVVTHGLVCHVLAERHLEPAGGVREVPRSWGNTSLTIVEGAPAWTVRLLNCTRHLEPDGASEAPRALPGGPA
jgi:probable phosphoglycerate mutase